MLCLHTALSRDVIESWQCPQQLLTMPTPLQKVKSICELKTGWDQWQPTQTEPHSKGVLSTQGCCLAQDADLKGHPWTAPPLWIAGLGDRGQSVFLPQDCFCGFTLHPSPLHARQAEEKDILRENRTYSKLNKHFAKYIPLTPAQQWGSTGGM